MFKHIAFALVLSGVAGFSSTTVANAASAPAAFYQFCAQNPSQCAAKGSGGAMKMDAKRWSELRSINGLVNRSIRETPDGGPNGDQWKVLIGGGNGDCEDFALTKRAKLIQAGWPSSALLMTVVRTRRGDGHAVLTVRTNEGDFVLDNLHSSIRTPRATGYRFYTRQSESNPRTWVAIAADGESKQYRTANVRQTPARAASSRVAARPNYDDPAFR